MIASGPRALHPRPTIRKWALETSAGCAGSMCRADHGMDCREQVAPCERLGDHLSNPKHCGGGARSEESRPELPGDRRGRPQRRASGVPEGAARPTRRVRVRRAPPGPRRPPDRGARRQRFTRAGATARTEYPSALSHSTRSSRMSLSSSMMTIPDVVGSGAPFFDSGDCIYALHRSGATPPFPMPVFALQM